MTSDIIILSLMLHQITPKAFLVSADEDIENAVWLPRSEVEAEQDLAIDDAGDFLVPEWLAIDRGLA
ncbi:MAG: hypothetical protein AAGI03_00605 [Pseudomonadota bacterium]